MAITNDIHLTGICASSPTTIKTKEGKSYSKVSIYEKHSWRDDKTGEQLSHKDYHVCVFYGENAKRAHKLLMQETKVHVQGVLKYRRKARNGVGKKYRYAEIKVDEFQLETKATWTKELYDSIYAAHYHIIIHKKEKSFDIEVMFRISEISSHFDEERLKKATFHFSIQASGKGNDCRPQAYTIDIGSSNERRYHQVIQQNHQYKRFIVKNVAIVPGFDLDESLINGSLLDEKLNKHYSYTFPFKDCVL